MTGELDTYRSKRDPGRTPEPVPDAGPLPTGADDTFVIQEHHATALHWDFRLERGGVLVSWAVPRGLPNDPGRNHLAVHTEDHPLDYAGFDGEIPAGEYGGGRVRMWDRGRYACETWTEREVKVVLHGQRVSGRFVLFRTRGKNWMVHRMDGPPRPDWQVLPGPLEPMTAVRGGLPGDDAQWGFELRYGGRRVLLAVQGGRGEWIRGLASDEEEAFARLPEVRALAAETGARELVLDAELVALGEDGRPDPARLERRLRAAGGAAAVRRLAASEPLTVLVADLVHLDGEDLTAAPYAQRRARLDELELTGPSWSTGPSFSGGGAAVLDAARDSGLPGVLGKRLDSPYRPGRRSRDWVEVAA